MGMLLFALVLGVILAIAAALAIWLALGEWTLMWRAMLTIAGASGGALIFCVVSGELEAEWLGLVWVVVVTITAMFVIVRLLGFRLMVAESDDRIASDEMQFSLRQLMALMAVFAIIAGAARRLTPLIATMEALIFGLAIAFCLGALSLFTMWVTLRSDNIARIKLSFLAIFAIAMAGLVYCGMEVTNADPGLIWAGVTLVFTIVLAGLLLLARQRGFRLRSHSVAIRQRPAMP
jgi:hypothetical protein